MEIRLNLMPINRNNDEESFIYERDNPIYDILKSIPKKIVHNKKEYKFQDSSLSLYLEILDLYYGEI